jgi:hypothetical protein
MDKDPRYEIDNPEAKEAMMRIAKLVAPMLPKGFGFSLFVFAYEKEDFFWISSAERPSMIKALKEFIQREQPQ